MDWAQKLTVTQKEARARGRAAGRDFCKALESLPYPLSLHVFADFAWGRRLCRNEPLSHGFPPKRARLGKRINPAHTL